MAAINFTNTNILAVNFYVFLANVKMVFAANALANGIRCNESLHDVGILARDKYNSLVQSANFKQNNQQKAINLPFSMLSYFPLLRACCFPTIRTN